MELIEGEHAPIKAWINGVDFEAGAREQLRNIATLPFIHSHVAAMPDVHVGIGATVGSVIATKGAIVPAAVGVDIGCGMIAQRTSLRAHELPDDLKAIRNTIERSIPVGNRGHNRLPAVVASAWAGLKPAYDRIGERHPHARARRAEDSLGTLGGGNHFIELTIDEERFVWIVLHSGSRGAGNRIGTFFIDRAKNEMDRLGVTLADTNLAYFTENTASFDEYVEAVGWAQSYARTNRDLMMVRIIEALRHPSIRLPEFSLTETAVNCHHNYVAREKHFGAEVYVTRKGAVRAGLGELGIIPGSMGAKSFIVRGKGNAQSFESCSHGVGRRLGRKEAMRRFTTGDLERETAGIECRKDAGVLDELPSAYKSIDAVMAAQADLIDIVHTMHQVVCVKG